MEHTRCVCLKVLFLVQFEKITTGWQLLDEQHILFKADSVKQAQEQLTFYTDAVSKPYKNCDQLWVRWKFDQVLDYYETDLPGLVDLGGLEVFSTFRNRRRKPTDYWDGTES